MYKVKWFTVNWNSTYPLVVDKVLSTTFDENKNHGFKSYRKRDDTLYSIYIKKKEIEEKIKNPLTNETISYKKIVYEQTKFCLENRNMGIELINPNRDIQEIINTFSSFSNFNMTIDTLEIDLSKFIKLLKLDFKSFVVNDIECKDIRTKNNTDIKLIAKNARMDVYKDVDIFLKNHDYIIEKMKCSLALDNTSISFELSNKGSFETHKKDSDIIVPIIKNKLLELII